MTTNIKEIELIVSGEVQSIGFRQYAAKAARKLKLAGFAENLKDGTVLIHCRGTDETISQFKNHINVKNPDAAPLIDVEEIKETHLAQGTINDTTFWEKYNESVSEMAQGFSTGMNYLNCFNVNTQASFKHMDEKYGKISQGMFLVVEAMEKRMEKTDKNIEALLKVLTEKKG
ncbi:MAG: acylphosphatase [Nanoarchaeota archaeon]|nr:acylphosphatase [Nanoarchaeota archaeon]MBU4300813.1 acylphosphatase [Nanoarchaeota archaeon]MBU4451488.1 acylphosphatase [Nanoarchaeota archaeon]MCG2723861.1 acylphosphatase [archaeon]